MTSTGTMSDFPSATAPPANGGLPWDEMDANQILAEMEKRQLRREEPDAAATLTLGTMTNDNDSSTTAPTMSDSPSVAAPPANGGHSWNEMNAGDGRIQELDARMKELQSMIEAKDARMQELQRKIVAKEDALCEKNAFILKCHRLLEANMQTM